MVTVTLHREVALAVSERAGEIDQQFLNQNIPFSEETGRIWATFRDAWDRFNTGFRRNEVTLALLHALKCAIQKAERYFARFSPA